MANCVVIMRNINSLLRVQEGTLTTVDWETWKFYCYDQCVDRFLGDSPTLYLSSQTGLSNE